MAKDLSAMERGSGSVHLNRSIDVFITGRSGTSKSILANGILGKEVVKERHGVVSVARSSATEFYSETIDGVQVNVWISSCLQDGGILNEVEYLQELKEKCLKVDLILYCLKMTETRFVPGNPDARAITKITETLGVKCWEKAVFVLTYANVAASVNYDPQAISTNGSRRAAFQKGIKMWKKVLQDTLFKEGGVPQSRLDIKVVPAGHYKQLHLPDRDYWLSVLWTECYETITNSETRQAFHQINVARFTTAREVTDSEISQYSITNQPLVTISQQPRIFMEKWKKVVLIMMAGGASGFLLGILILGSYPWALFMLCCGSCIGAYAGNVYRKKDI